MSAPELVPGAPVLWHLEGANGKPNGLHRLAVVVEYRAPWLAIRPLLGPNWGRAWVFPEHVEVGAHVVALYVAWRMGVQPAEWDDYDA